MSNSKEDSLLSLKGSITERLPNAMFRVNVDIGDGKGYSHEIIAYSSGKMKKNHITMVVNDIVVVEMSSTDLTKGRIVLRESGYKKPINNNTSNQNSNRNSGYNSNKK